MHELGNTRGGIDVCAGHSCGGAELTVATAEESKIREMEVA